MKSFYLTDAGRVRSHNEDSVTIVKNQNGEHLMMVADGMGGHRAGEIASSMVVTHLGSRFANLSTIGTKFDAVNWLNENINTVNTNILKYTEENPSIYALSAYEIKTKRYETSGTMQIQHNVLKEFGYPRITTLEEYKQYNRQMYRLWYQKNREKKLQYNRDRYYNLKNKSKNNSEVNQ